MIKDNLQIDNDIACAETLPRSVEMKKEEVVDSVQRGVRSRLYDCGRYAPGVKS